MSIQSIRGWELALESEMVAGRRLAGSPRGFEYIIAFVWLCWTGVPGPWKLEHVRLISRCSVPCAATFPVDRKPINIAFDDPRRRSRCVTSARERVGMFWPVLSECHEADLAPEPWGDTRIAATANNKHEQQLQVNSSLPPSLQR